MESYPIIHKLPPVSFLLALLTMFPATLILTLDGAIIYYEHMPFN